MYKYLRIQKLSHKSLICSWFSILRTKIRRAKQENQLSRFNNKKQIQENLPRVKVHVIIHWPNNIQTYFLAIFKAHIISLSMELILDFYHIYELSNSQLNLTLQKTSKIGRLAPIRCRITTSLSSTGMGDGEKG